MFYQDNTCYVVTVNHVLVFVFFFFKQWGFEFLALLLHLLLPLLKVFFLFLNDSFDALLVLAVGVSASLSTNPLNRFDAFSSFKLHRFERLCTHRTYHLLEILCFCKLFHVVVTFCEELRLGCLRWNTCKLMHNSVFVVRIVYLSWLKFF